MEISFEDVWRQTKMKWKISDACFVSLDRVDDPWPSWRVVRFRSRCCLLLVSGVVRRQVRLSSLCHLLVFQQECTHSCVLQAHLLITRAAREPIRTQKGRQEPWGPCPQTRNPNTMFWRVFVLTAPICTHWLKRTIEPRCSVIRANVSIQGSRDEVYQIANALPQMEWSEFLGPVPLWVMEPRSSNQGGGGMIGSPVDMFDSSFDGETCMGGDGTCCGMIAGVSCSVGIDCVSGSW